MNSLWLKGSPRVTHLADGPTSELHAVLDKIAVLQTSRKLRTMPIYEYSCEDCGTKFEKLVRGNMEVLCPSCGESHLKQEHSTFAAHAGSSGSQAQQQMGGGCPAGMCGTPGLCGRN